jgi:hypothetical protein
VRSGMPGWSSHSIIQRMIACLFRTEDAWVLGVLSFNVLRLGGLGSTRDEFAP